MLWLSAVVKVFASSRLDSVISSY